MADTTWASRVVRRYAVATVKVFLWVRIAIGILGAVGGLLAVVFGLVSIPLLLLNHGFGVALGGLGGGGAVHGHYYLVAAGHRREVSAVMFWFVWLTQIVMFSGGGLMLLMFGVEGMVWLVRGESFVWGRRGERKK